MNLAGSKIDFPFRPDIRGEFATTANRSDIVAQAIQDILETRRFERVLMPDYGIDDFVFAVQDLSFAARLAYHLEEQIIKYVPLVADMRIKVANDDEGRAIIEIEYLEVGEVNAPRNLVFPVWKYQENT